MDNHLRGVQPAGGLAGGSGNRPGRIAQDTHLQSRMAKPDSASGFGTAFGFWKAAWLSQRCILSAWIDRTAP